MPQYDVTLIWTVSKTITVSADTPEQAQGQAENAHGHLSLCHHCSNHAEPDDLHSVLVHDDSGTQVLPEVGHAEE